MDRNLQEMMSQMKTDPAHLQALMRSQDGKKLIELLTKDGQAQQAAQSAMRGDTSAITALIGRLNQTQDGAELMGRINNTFNPKK